MPNPSNSAVGRNEVELHDMRAAAVQEEPTSKETRAPEAHAKREEAADGAAVAARGAEHEADGPKQKKVGVRLVSLLFGAMAIALAVELAILVARHWAEIGAAAASAWEGLSGFTEPWLLVLFLLVLIGMAWLMGRIVRREGGRRPRARLNDGAKLFQLSILIGLLGFIGTLRGFREAMGEFVHIDLSGFERAIDTTTVALGGVAVVMGFLMFFPPKERE